MKTILIAATALSLLATPVMAARSHGPDSGIALSKQGEWHGERQGNNNHQGRDREAFNNGPSYGHGDRYRGWNHYSSRPSDWSDRGCVSVGPLWYCQ
jgi:hypothetical protein